MMNGKFYQTYSCTESLTNLKMRSKKKMKRIKRLMKVDLELELKMLE